jgi:hypothetical protein
MGPSLQVLQALAENAKQQCCSTATPYMVTYGTAIYSPNAASFPAQPPAMDACANAIKNFELQFRTIDNGAYANNAAPQAWRQEQGKAIINCVGTGMQAAGLPVSPMNYPVYMPAAMALGNQLASAVPSLAGYQSQLPVFPSASATINFPRASISAGTNPFLASNAAYPFSSGVQVMPYIPAIPVGY